MASKKAASKKIRTTRQTWVVFDKDYNYDEYVRRFDGLDCSEFHVIKAGERFRVAERRFFGNHHGIRLDDGKIFHLFMSEKSIDDEKEIPKKFWHLEEKVIITTTEESFTRI